MPLVCVSLFKSLRGAGWTDGEVWGLTFLFLSQGGAEGLRGRRSISGLAGRLHRTLPPPSPVNSSAPMCAGAVGLAGPALLPAPAHDPGRGHRARRLPPTCRKDGTPGTQHGVVTPPPSLRGFMLGGARCAAPNTPFLHPSLPARDTDGATVPEGGHDWQHGEVVCWPRAGSPTGRPSKPSASPCRQQVAPRWPRVAPAAPAHRLPWRGPHDRSARWKQQNRIIHTSGQRRPGWWPQPAQPCVSACPGCPGASLEPSPPRGPPEPLPCLNPGAHPS